MDGDEYIFHDLNAGCKKKVVSTYTDCEGNCFTVETEIDCPYLQGSEILPPVFISATQNGVSFKSSEITEFNLAKTGGGEIHLKYPLKVNDIVVTSQNSTPEYLIYERQKRKSPLGRYVYKIKRLDGSLFTATDVSNFSEGTVVKVKGYLQNK